MNSNLKYEVWTTPRGATPTTWTGSFNVFNVFNAIVYTAARGGFSSQWGAREWAHDAGSSFMNGAQWAIDNLSLVKE